MINELKQKQVQEFISKHLDDDPASVVLSNKDIAGVDIRVIAEQIRAKQKAAKKFPTWADNPNIIFPSALSVEQASSFETADYKAALKTKGLCIDLTGGLGVDTLAFAKNFEKVIYVETDPVKVEAAKNNFEVLGQENIEVVNSSAEDFISRFDQKASLIFLDPDRRPGKQKVLGLEESLPNVVELKEVLLDKAENVLIKASPMTDISATLKLFPEIIQVHTLAINNDCKELLFLLEKETAESHKIVAANYTGEEWQLFEASGQEKPEYALPETYLYEPNAAILKAGLQDNLSTAFNVKKLHPSTHLFTSENLQEDFPGRIFHLKDILPVNKKAVKIALPDPKANLSTRNFPEHVDKLKKKLGIKDGGNYYIFACRLRDNTYKLLLTQKAI
ncbi:MAG: THUMP-like domain-containing protein [Candidatus Cyclobacteriaceae bacterium M2_1C_046]